MSPIGPALDPDERGDHADAELGTQLEHRVVVGESVDDGAHVVDAQPVLGDHVPQRALVGTRPRRHRPLEVRQVLLRDGDRLGFVLDGDVDDAVRHLHGHRPDVFGCVHAEAAAFDHRRTAHADVRVGGRDHDVAAAEQRRVAGEAPSRVDADQRHEPAQRTPQRERHAVEPGHAGPVGVARPSAAALGEEDDRQAQALGQLEQAVLLAMVLQALRAGEDGVVVRHHDRAVAVDGADAADQTVGRRPADEVVELAPAALRGDDHRPVLDEAAGVDEVVDVLARRALPRPAPALDRIGPLLVVAERVPLHDLGEIVHGCRRARRRPSTAAATAGGGLALDDGDEEIAGVHGGADLDADPVDHAGVLRRDHVLHLHRLDDEQAAGATRPHPRRRRGW